MLREDGLNALALSGIWHTVKKFYPEEWLLPLEIAELLTTHELPGEILEDIFQYLEKKKSESDELRCLINDGLQLISVHHP